MKRWQLGVLSAIFGVVAAGSAWAALGMAEWKFYRSDLIRCEDAANLGLNACGTSNVGDDRLKSGRVTLDGKSLTAVLTRAEPNEVYFLDFIPLRNTGTDPDGSYEAEDRLWMGVLFTNRAGNATLRTENMDIVGPQLGYFVISSLDFDEDIDVSALSVERPQFRASLYENEEREFVTGFDPDFLLMHAPVGN